MSIDEKFSNDVKMRSTCRDLFGNKPFRSIQRT